MDNAKLDELEQIVTAIRPLMEENTILMDCVDNSGRAYTSAWLADRLGELANAYDAAILALTPKGGN